MASAPAPARGISTPAGARCERSAWWCPSLVLAASYLWLANDHGTLLLWNVIVHESGRYTFGQTVLYFSHFLREVPTAMAYALFLLGISGAVARRRPALTRASHPASAGALALAGVLVAARCS
jgi:hypothetical protein